MGIVRKFRNRKKKALDKPIVQYDDDNDRYHLSLKEIPDSRALSKALRDGKNKDAFI